MSKTYFISDAHLGADNPKIEKLKEEKLLTFLDYVAENGNQLFIVGDLFDFWFEYITVIPKGFSKVL
jgi:UDP-2,3-diacylglucosamine hydrolase